MFHVFIIDVLPAWLKNPHRACHSFDTLTEEANPISQQTHARSSTRCIKSCLEGMNIWQDTKIKAERFRERNYLLCCLCVLLSDSWYLAHDFHVVFSDGELFLHASTRLCSSLNCCVCMGGKHGRKPRGELDWLVKGNALFPSRVLIKILSDTYKNHLCLSLAKTNI